MRVLLAYVLEREDEATYYGALLAAAEGESAAKIGRSLMQAMFPFMPDDAEVKRVAIERLGRFIASGAAFTIRHDLQED